MINVKLPITTKHRLVFYLAMEEYLAGKCGREIDKDMFFVWRVAPTVIFGRNQDIEAEVNLDFCKENGIEFYRRKSGGGCVYADWGNVMISYITCDTNVNEVFNRYLDSLADALCRLGFDAVKTEHNDILISDRKVSGNAFYALPHSSIVHGTLLCDVDFEMLGKAITPSKEKLESHGVKSVRQRVENLKQLRVNGQQPTVLNKDVASASSVFDIEEICNKLVSSFCDEEMTLSEDDIKNIEAIEKDYLDENFIYGKSFH